VAEWSDYDEEMQRLAEEIKSGKTQGQNASDNRADKTETPTPATAHTEL
jgi:hypothetical protein